VRMPVEQARGGDVRALANPEIHHHLGIGEQADKQAAEQAKERAEAAAERRGGVIHSLGRILGQTGAFVPANTAVLPIVDRVFARVARRPPDEDPRAVPVTVLVPAFVVGELRSAFGIGFALYLPFVAIDLAVSAILMALGMMMLSPTVVSLPVKLLLFVMVDGWALVCQGVVQSFR